MRASPPSVNVPRTCSRSPTSATTRWSTPDSSRHCAKHCSSALMETATDERCEEGDEEGGEDGEGREAAGEEGSAEGRDARQRIRRPEVSDRSKEGRRGGKESVSTSGYRWDGSQKK